MTDSCAASSGPSCGWQSLFWGGNKTDQGLFANWSIVTGCESTHWARAGVTPPRQLPWGREGLVVISPGQSPCPGDCLKVAPIGEGVGTGHVLFRILFFFWCLFLLCCRFLSDSLLSLSLPHSPPHLPYPLQGRGATAGQTLVCSSILAQGRARLTFCYPISLHTSLWVTQTAALTPKCLVGWAPCWVLSLGVVSERYK